MPAQTENNVSNDMFYTRKRTDPLITNVLQSDAEVAT